MKTFFGNHIFRDLNVRIGLEYFNGSYQCFSILRVGVLVNIVKYCEKCGRL